MQTSDVNDVLCGQSMAQFVENFLVEMNAAFRKFSMDDGYAFTRRFFYLLRDLSRSANDNDSKIFLLVAHPDPIEYFERNFNFIPAVAFDNADSDQDYMDLLNMIPSNGNISDSISSRAEAILLFSRNRSWMIFVDRNSIDPKCLIACKFDYDFYWGN